MNPYSVECGDRGTVESDLGFEAAIGHVLEHTCQIVTDDEIVPTGELAEGNR